MQRTADAANAAQVRAGRRRPGAGGRDPIMPPGAECPNRRLLCFPGSRVDKSAAEPKQIAAAGNCRAARLDRDIGPTFTQRVVYGVRSAAWRLAQQPTLASATNPIQANEAALRRWIVKVIFASLRISVSPCWPLWR